MRDDKSLIETERVKIYQRETNTTVLRFLIPSEIEGNPMDKFVCVFKFILPGGTKYCIQPTKQEELYNGFIDLQMPLTSDLTEEYGMIRGNLTFLAVVDGEEGEEQKALAMHSGDVCIKIHKKTDIFAGDPKLEALDQRILKLEDMLAKVTDASETYDDEKADDIEFIDGEIWLMSHGEKIGSPIPYDTLEPEVQDTIKESLDGCTIDGGAEDMTVD